MELRPQVVIVGVQKFRHGVQIVNKRQTIIKWPKQELPWLNPISIQITKITVYSQVIDKHNIEQNNSFNLVLPINLFVKFKQVSTNA